MVRTGREEVDVELGWMLHYRPVEICASSFPSVLLSLLIISFHVPVRITGWRIHEQVVPIIFGCIYICRTTACDVLHYKVGRAQYL